MRTVFIANTFIRLSVYELPGDERVRMQSMYTKRERDHQYSYADGALSRFYNSRHSSTKTPMLSLHCTRSPISNRSISLASF